MNSSFLNKNILEMITQGEILLTWLNSYDGLTS